MGRFEGNLLCGLGAREANGAASFLNPYARRLADRALVHSDAHPGPVPALDRSRPHPSQDGPRLDRPALMNRRLPLPHCNDVRTLYQMPELVEATVRPAERDTGQQRDGPASRHDRAEDLHEQPQRAQPETELRRDPNPGRQLRGDSCGSFHDELSGVDENLRDLGRDERGRDHARLMAHEVQCQNCKIGSKAANLREDSESSSVVTLREPDGQSNAGC